MAKAELIDEFMRFLETFVFFHTSNKKKKRLFIDGVFQSNAKPINL